MEEGFFRPLGPEQPSSRRVRQHGAYGNHPSRRRLDPSLSPPPGVRLHKFHKVAFGLEGADDVVEDEVHEEGDPRGGVPGRRRFRGVTNKLHYPLGVYDYAHFQGNWRRGAGDEYTLVGIPQGSGPGERVGSSVHLNFIRFHGMVVYVPPASDRDDPEQIRVIVVMDKASHLSISPPSPSLVYSPGEASAVSLIDSFRNPDNAMRFDVLLDELRTFNVIQPQPIISVHGSLVDGTGDIVTDISAVIPPDQIAPFNFDIECDFDVAFADVAPPNSGADWNIRFNNVYVLLYSRTERVEAVRLQGLFQVGYDDC